MADPVAVVDLANRLTGPFISATGDETSNVVFSESANLPSLPNELFHQVIEFLDPIEEMKAADGFGSATNSTYDGLKVDLTRRQARAGRIRLLMDID
jgi:hypothetical protein